MRNLLLGAKWFALRDEADTITIEHLKKAVENFRFEGELDELIHDYLEITPASGPVDPVLTPKALRTAKEHPRLPFDNEVKRFVRYMKIHSVTLDSEISFLKEKKPTPRPKAVAVSADAKNEKIAAFRHTVATLENSLKEKIFGQDDAIEAVCDKIAEIFYNPPRDTPRAIFFFLGPPATGKTMLARLLSENLEGYGHYRFFDMTQYTSENEGFGLFGLTEGYTDAKEGRLTSFVKKHPRSVIVFDEIEKAHPGVLQNFLQLLGSGEAIDGYTGETVDFRETVLVFTSNLGSELYNSPEFLDALKHDPVGAANTLLEAVGREEKTVRGNRTKAIPAELLSRLSQGKLVLFRKLPYGALAAILGQSLEAVKERFVETFGIEVELKDPELLHAAVILSFSPHADPRRLKSQAPQHLFDIVTDWIRRSDTTPEKILFRVDENAARTLRSDLLDRPQTERNRLLRTLFRRNETYSHTIRCETEAHTLTLTLENLQRKKLDRAADYGSDAGLVFDIPDINFRDIAGHTAAKTRLEEIVRLLRSPEPLKSFGVRTPRGMLLYGPPGTGKTMLAKAFANEADLPFIETTGTEMLDIDRMKQVFRRARDYAPAIVFIDEIDAFGRRDGSPRDIVINQFLSELSGFSDSPQNRIFIISATNFIEKIDPAILRSGRIDLHIEIDRLDREARRWFLKKILEKPSEGPFDMERLLTYTAGMSGADLQKVARESALYLFRHGLDKLTEEILVEQINTVKYGSRLSCESVDALLASTAVHEAGHAVVSHILLPKQRIEQVTVAPRANALGFVSYDREKRLKNMTRREIRHRMAVALAGREAQIRAYGEEGIDSGAASDLAQATALAHHAVTELGMGERTGPLSLQSLKKTELFSQTVEADIRRWLDDARATAAELVQTHWHAIEALAKALREKESVDGTAFEAIVDDHTTRSP